MRERGEKLGNIALSQGDLDLFYLYFLCFLRMC